MAADRHPGRAGAVVVAHLSERHVKPLRVFGHLVPQRLRDAGRQNAPRHVDAGRSFDDDAELAGLAAHLVRELAEALQQRLGAQVGVIQLGLHALQGGGRLHDAGLLLGVHDAAACPVEEELPAQQHHGYRRDQGGRDHPERQRGAPDCHQGPDESLVFPGHAGVRHQSTPVVTCSPARYPTPRTVTTISGRSGSSSIFERSRCTCTLTSRVSAACR